VPTPTRRDVPQKKKKQERRTEYGNALLHLAEASDFGGISPRALRRCRKKGGRPAWKNHVLSPARKKHPNLMISNRERKKGSDWAWTCIMITRKKKRKGRRRSSLLSKRKQRLGTARLRRGGRERPTMLELGPGSRKEEKDTNSGRRQRRENVDRFRRRLLLFAAKGPRLFNKPVKVLSPSPYFGKRSLSNYLLSRKKREKKTKRVGKEGGSGITSHSHRGGERLPFKHEEGGERPLILPRSGGRKLGREKLKEKTSSVRFADEEDPASPPGKGKRVPA